MTTKEQFIAYQDSLEEQPEPPTSEQAKELSELWVKYIIENGDFTRALSASNDFQMGMAMGMKACINKTYKKE